METFQYKYINPTDNIIIEYNLLDMNYILLLNRLNGIATLNELEFSKELIDMLIKNNYVSENITTLSDTEQDLFLFNLIKISDENEIPLTVTCSCKNEYNTKVLLDDVIDNLTKRLSPDFDFSVTHQDITYKFLISPYKFIKRDENGGVTARVTQVELNDKIIIEKDEILKLYMKLPIAVMKQLTVKLPSTDVYKKHVKCPKCKKESDVVIPNITFFLKRY